MNNPFKKQTKKTGNTDLKQVAIANGIARFITKVQQRWADWMAKRSERMSIRAKWITLTIFCLLTAGSCIYLTCASLQSVSIKTPKVSRIRAPIQSVPLKRSKPVISEGEYRKLRDYRLYMDSLARSPAGMPQYLKFRQQHPGLLDSIRTIEKIYESQLNQ